MEKNTQGEWIIEKLAYSRKFLMPNLDNELKSIISLSLDYFGIERKSLFD